MKIVLIVDYYYPAVGGAETLYQKLAESLAKDHQVVVITQEVHQAASEEVYNRVHVYRVSTWHRALFPYQAFSVAKRLVKDADIIQAATYSSGVLAARLRPYTNAKVLLLVHEYLNTRWLRFGCYGLQAFLYEKFLFRYRYDHYVTVSESTKKQLLRLGIYPKQITHIYNGIDSQLFQPQKVNWALREQLNIGKEQLVCLFAGRPAVTKGVFLLLEAIREVQRLESKEQRTDRWKFVLLLAKEPARQRKKVEKLIRRYNLQNSVLLLDSVPRVELPSYFSMANTVVVPSLCEGFGFLAAEVSAMKIPLIVSRIDSLPEVVSGKVIFIEKPTSAAIVESLHAAFQKQYISIAHKLFSWDDTVHQYLELYRYLSK
ncbi:MAG: glycosyltransferase family 4 protein [Candidatus Abawacabacteria bacterium]|nr:glycosyltransferase family 4 protein [Candidatus Abawacabacteria bacterium]